MANFIHSVFQITIRLRSHYRRKRNQKNLLTQCESIRQKQKRKPSFRQNGRRLHVLRSKSRVKGLEMSHVIG